MMVKFLIVGAVVVVLLGLFFWKRAQEEPVSLVQLPTDDERGHMRLLAAELQAVVRILISEVAPGMTTKDIDRRAAQLLREHGMVAAMDGYNGFPAATAISLNEEVLHGIPSAKRTTEDGGCLRRAQVAEG